MQSEKQMLARRLVLTMCLWSCRRGPMLLLNLAVGYALTACADVRHFEWSEDLRLSNGLITTVHRFEDYRRVTDIGAGFQTGLLFQRAGISAQVPPSKQKIEFEGVLEPLALDVTTDGRTYLVCDVSTGASRNEWNVPRSQFYVAFRAIDGNLSKIPLTELPASIQPNLLPYAGLYMDEGFRATHHIDEKTKRSLIDRMPPNDRLRVIVLPGQP